MKLTEQDYKNKIKSLELENKLLKFQLENFESIQRGKCCDCCEDAIQDYVDIKSEIDKIESKYAPFKDKYFNGLFPSQIADLAKEAGDYKIENEKLQTKLDKISEILEIEELSEDSY